LQNNSKLSIKNSTLLTDLIGLIDNFGCKPDMKLADGIGEFFKCYGEDI